MGENPLSLILMLVVMVVVMYFFIIRPNKKKQKAEEELRSSIQVGNEILTIGGIYGKIIAVKEDSFVLESGPDRSKVRVAKWAVQKNLSAETAEPKEVIAKRTEK